MNTSSIIRLSLLILIIGESCSHAETPNMDLAPIKVSADKNNPQAQYELGMRHLNGEGIEKNKDKAIEHITRAAILGHEQAYKQLEKLLEYESDDVPIEYLSLKDSDLRMLAEEKNDRYAQSMMGDRYGQNIFDGTWKAPKKAFYWYKKSAEQGFAKAQRKLSNCYLLGMGTPKDTKEAVKWMQKAVEQNSSMAQYEMGLMLIRGDGVPKSYKKAAVLIKKAAVRGVVMARVILGLMHVHGDGVEKNYQEAIYWFKKAEMLTTSAQYNVGVMYRDGLGVHRDRQKAIRAFNAASKGKDEYAQKAKQALIELKNTPIPISPGTEQLPPPPPFDLIKPIAHNGNAEAQFQLGRCYSQGIGTTKNEMLAHEWFKKSAEQGHAIAQYNLATSYLKGLGVKANEDKAREWYKKSAEQGYIRSQCHLGHLEIIGGSNKPNPKQAFHWFMLAAQQGNIMAQKSVGLLLRQGLGCKADHIACLEWLSKAAAQGDTDAQKLLDSSFSYYKEKVAIDNNPAMLDALAFCYENGFGVDRNFDKCVILYHKAAKGGNAHAQNAIAYLYNYGLYGVPQDSELAFEWYKKAAEQGHVSAMVNFGYLYETGNGTNSANPPEAFYYPACVKQDLDIALSWYAKAAQLGHKRANYYMSQIYYAKNNQTKYAEALRKACEQGDVEALAALAYFHRENKNVSEKELKNDVLLFEKLAILGNRTAQNCLSEMYKNYPEIRQSLEIDRFEDAKKRAEAGDVTQQSRVGLKYIMGNGTQKDPLQAIIWLTLAAKAGNREAQYNLGKIYENGDGIEKSPTKAIKWYTKAANNNLTEAQNSLAACYSHGIGVQKDDKLAFIWFYLASAQGHPLGTCNLGICYEQGLGTPQNLEKALKCYYKSMRLGEPIAEKYLSALLYKHPDLLKQKE